MCQIIKNISLTLVIILALFLLELVIPKPTIAAESVPTSSNSQLLKEASEQVVDEVDSTKNMFGKTESGNQLIDQAREEAKSKLKDVEAKSENNSQSLSPHKQNFLENLQGK